MDNLEILSQSEREMLLKFPAYISLLAAHHEGPSDEIDKRSAIKFSHIKTYTCHPMLYEFYREADKVFEKNFNTLDKLLPKRREERETAIRIELIRLEKILLKLGPKYASIMHYSMKTFKNHVSRAHFNVLEYFIFPLPLEGITN